MSSAKQTLGCIHCDDKGEVPVTPGQPGDGARACPYCEDESHIPSPGCPCDMCALVRITLSSFGDSR